MERRQAKFLPTCMLTSAHSILYKYSSWILSREFMNKHLNTIWIYSAKQRRLTIPERGTYRVYSNRTQAKKIIMILTFARFSGKGRQLLH